MMPGLPRRGHHGDARILVATPASRNDALSVLPRTASGRRERTVMPLTWSFAIGAIVAGSNILNCRASVGSTTGDDDLVVDVS